MLPVGRLYMNFELCTRPSQGTSRLRRCEHKIMTCNFLVTLGRVALRSVTFLISDMVRKALSIIERLT